MCLSPGAVEAPVVAPPAAVPAPILLAVPAPAPAPAAGVPAPRPQQEQRTQQRGAQQSGCSRLCTNTGHTVDSRLQRDCYSAFTWVLLIERLWILEVHFVKIRLESIFNIDSIYIHMSNSKYVGQGPVLAGLYKDCGL